MHCPTNIVFPTPVGVFPRQRQRRYRWRCLPHARGGVSYKKEALIALAMVFPTPVGVFPHLASAGQLSAGLPHARGGVSSMIKQGQGFQ